MTKRQRQGIWILWFLSVPLFIYIIVHSTLPVFLDHWLAVLSFLCLLIIASWFPLKFRHGSIVPLHGITLAVFLLFGFAVEVIVMQLAIFTSLLSLRTTVKELYRFPLNSLIFLIVSAISAAIFYLLGGMTGNITQSDLVGLSIPVLGYAFSYFFLNNWIIFVLRKYISGNKNSRFFDELLAWEAVSAILIIPVGITLVLLYQDVGYSAIFLIGFPLVLLSLFLKLYNESEQTASLLKKVSSFGYKVNEGLPVDDIYDLFLETIAAVFPLEQVLLYDRVEDDIRVIKIHHLNGRRIQQADQSDGISRKVFQTGKSLHFNRSSQWNKQGDMGLVNNAQSIISAPVMRDHQVVGVITLTSERIGAFEKSHLMVLEIMANYLSVAVQNARNYEKTKQESERCALTKLYNFRYFENLLLEAYDNSQKQYAIILIDLDHFKQINDTYGHQSGNEILTQVAQVLKNTVAENGVLARYGGEEFVVLLEGQHVPFAQDIAEAIRQAIESHLFAVVDDLKGRERKSVRITASIGVASKLEEDESAMSVLRNADRAMYMGAKQKGRNRVSLF
nr:sensor domain-containing diguanylate cyclase [Evansella caseinilytica]